MWVKSGSLITLFCILLSSCNTQQSRAISGEIAALLIEFLNTKQAIETVSRDVKRTYSPTDERRLAVQRSYNEGRGAIGRYFGALRAATQIGDAAALDEITAATTTDVAGVLATAVTAIDPNGGARSVKSVNAYKLPGGAYRAFQSVPVRDRMQLIRDAELRVMWIPWEEL